MKKKRGRPRVAEPLAVKYDTRYTQTDAQRVAKAAKIKGVKLGTFIREAVLKETKKVLAAANQAPVDAYS